MEEIKEKILKFGERAIADLVKENIEELTPERTDNYLSFLSAYSAQLELEFGQLTKAEPIYWSEYRKATKTNHEADRLWAATDMGQRQIELKFLIKATDKIISACKKRLDRLNHEAFNRY